MLTLRLNTTKQDIIQAAQLLRQGELVAFPTETVYGLGAHAMDTEAVDKIFQAKGRPSDNPLIVHIADQKQLVELVDNIPQTAYKLMEAFWPGPLTLILPRRPGIPDRVTAGLNTVGVRMPDHPVALQLLKETGLPIAAPSANQSGRPSPTTASHVLEDLDKRIAAVVDGGATGVGVESTVLDVTVTPPMILRPGGVTKEMLEQVIGEVGIAPSLTKEPGSDMDPKQALGNTTLNKGERAPRAPGMKYTHYAPKADMWIVKGPVDKQVAQIQNLVEKSRRESYKTGVLTTEEHQDQYRADVVLSCGKRNELETVAAKLYDVLREFDQTEVDRIYAESFPEKGIGLAIMNRLKKAAGYRIIDIES